MTNKVKNTPDSSILSISKEEFKKLIDNQINKGSELLKMNVEHIVGYGQPFFTTQNYNRNIKNSGQIGFKTFTNEYDKWVNVTDEILKRSFTIPENEYRHNFDIAGQTAFITRDQDRVAHYMEAISDKINYLESLKVQSDFIPVNLNEKSKYLKENDVILPSNKIFIVHGHNETINHEVARTIEKLGLEAIILREQPNSGQTIIEKFENNAKETNFAVILMTADDKVGENEEFRARQNVIFEMGYFMGKLGRSHVMCLLQNDVEKPGDIDGVVYTPLDPSGVWKFSLVKELKECGYKVDANKIM